MKKAFIVIAALVAVSAALPIDDRVWPLRYYFCLRPMAEVPSNYLSFC